MPKYMASSNKVAMVTLQPPKLHKYVKNLLRVALNLKLHNIVYLLNNKILNNKLLIMAQLLLLFQSIETF